MCLAEEEGEREDRSRLGARLRCDQWARAGLWLERSGAGEGPAALPETRAAQSGEEAEPACPPRTVGCWGNFAARSGGSILNVDGRSEFTLVYKTAQQGNGRVGGGGGPLPAPRTGTRWGKRPCALYPKCSFAARFIGESLAYCGTFRLCGSLIGRNIPRGMSLSLCYRAIGGRAVWGRALLGTRSSLCFRCLLFFSSVERAGRREEAS